MPLAPHYPSDEPEDIDHAPDLNEVINRILNDEHGETRSVVHGG
jgi:hypothetical protein